MKKIHQLSASLILGVILVLAVVLFGGPKNQESLPLNSDLKEGEVAQVLIETELLVDGSSSYVSVEPGSSALDLMNMVAEETDEFSFEGKESEFGVFVETINGLSNDTGESRYWSLYVNDKLSVVGAADYIINDGDLIEWRYEQVDF